MISGNAYIKLVKAYNSFLINELNYNVIDEKVRGNAFYDVQYGNGIKTISVSYENIEDYLQVIIFVLDNGKLPDYDNKEATLHLNKLNQYIIARVDKSVISNNKSYFSEFKPQSEIEKKLLKNAIELRLCLNNWLEYYL